LIICDLPYGCLADNRKKAPNIRRADNGKPLPRMNDRITGCGWDTKIDLEAFWKEVKRIRKNEHSPTIHFCTTKFGYDLIKSNEKEFRYDLVWDKQRGVSFLRANKMPMRSHEMIYVFSKAGAFYERKDTPKESNEGKQCVLSIIKQIGVVKKDEHPTSKPIELYKWLIERYCPPEGTVLDPTFGSCNSGTASKELNRNYIGIEMNKDFFDKVKIDG
jgi:site-specific DNA-methyltransferase (adenine-specific)